MKDINNYENKPWEIHPTARRFECGSPNMLGIHALSASLSLLLETGMPKVESLLLEKTEYLRSGIEKNDRLNLLSPLEPKLHSGIFVFAHQAVGNAEFHQYLMEQGVICAVRGNGIRFSPHFYTSPDDLANALAIIDSFS